MPIYSHSFLTRPVVDSNALTLYVSILGHHTGRQTDGRGPTIEYFLFPDILTCTEEPQSKGKLPFFYLCTQQSTESLDIKRTHESVGI